MSRRPRAPTRGFTLLEAIVGCAIGLMAIGIATSLLASTHDLTRDARADVRCAAEHRRNMQSLATILQVVDPATLTGFGPGGEEATSLSFKRITGRLDGQRTLSDTETLEWRASSIPVDGVAHPGAVWLIGPGGMSMAANRVPQGGFGVTRDGKTLRIRLTTYYATSQSKTLFAHTESSISVRN
jgi:hypothetical protein